MQLYTIAGAILREQNDQGVYLVSERERERERESLCCARNQLVVLPHSLSALFGQASAM